MNWHWTLKYLDYESGLQLLHFTGFGLENIWITDLDFDCYISHWILT